MRQKNFSDRLTPLLQRIYQYQPEKEQGERELKWMVDELISRRKPRNSNWKNHSNSFLSTTEWNRLEYWIHQREKGKPLQYVLGNQPFAGLSIKLRQPVLIPRWETEEWTIRLIQSLLEPPQPEPVKFPLRVLDLCSGTGCISLALAHHLSFTKIDALDISHSAWILSRFNQRKLGIPPDRLSFHKLDLFSRNLEEFENYDIVVANPPYISPKEYESLDPSVKNYEDVLALKASDEQGIAFYKRIVSCDWLFAGSTSRLIMEIGHGQGELVSDLLQTHGFRSIRVVKDLAGRDRTVEAVK